jgi:hypothetical protein
LPKRTAAPGTPGADVRTGNSQAKTDASNEWNTAAAAADPPAELSYLPIDAKGCGVHTSVVIIEAGPAGLAEQSSDRPIGGIE